MEPQMRSPAADASDDGGTSTATETGNDAQAPQCGSDAMNINGKNGLACLTNMRQIEDPVVLKPLPGLPVIRDLIVDMTQFFKPYHSVKPYLFNDELPPAKERLQSPEERDELNGLYECILCASCTSTSRTFTAYFAVGSS